MIVLIHADMELWDFILDGVRNRDDFLDIPLDRFTTIVQKGFRKLFPSGDFPALFVLGRQLRKHLHSLNRGDKVIVSAYTSPTLFNAVRRCVNNDVRINLWMWNPIKKNYKFKKNISLLKDLGFSLHSFDQDDCSSYGMKYHNSFYNMSNFTTDNTSFKHDFYFLGAAKDRGDQVREIQHLLEKYSCLFLIPTQPSEYISYRQNLDNIQSSKCIVEVLQKQQHDISLRPLEAIAFKRKLLTNNLAILDYSFYDPNNIFVLGKDNLDNLDSFLNSPFVEVSKDVLQEFDVNTWIDSF